MVRNKKYFSGTVIHPVKSVSPPPPLFTESSMINVQCKVGIGYGQFSEKYSFPGGHPLNNSRTSLFFSQLEKQRRDHPNSITFVEEKSANEEEILSFHTKEYLARVKQASAEGRGFLDYGDTPAFKGVYEVSSKVVGTTLSGMRKVLLKQGIDHFFNPVGGLHHARRDSAEGFCVFNDAAVAIAVLEKEFPEIQRILYVDIDAHHGDGVFYGFEYDPKVFFADIHEDGHYLFPGTGFRQEAGKGEALGTKLNIPLEPEASDEDFLEAFQEVKQFVNTIDPQFIILQCGADGLAGDPITHLTYSSKVHREVALFLHEAAHKYCDGRVIALGGGGYNASNVKDAWLEVVEAFVFGKNRAS
jgi:acetoin utilization protein AcuC